MKANELWQKVNSEDANFLFYLWERWQDEKEYEDIQEYLKAIQKSIPEAFKITKRPFGIVCECDDGQMHIQIKRQGNYLKMFGKIKRK